MTCQAGILIEPVPSVARHLFFVLDDTEQLTNALLRLTATVNTRDTVVGLGIGTLQALHIGNEKLHAFPALSHSGIHIPSTQHALWCWLRGEDRGELLYRTRAIDNALAPAFKRIHTTEAFRYLTGHDLSGYEDGTENAKGDEAAAIVNDSAAPYGTYATVQHWVHNLAQLHALPQHEQDHIIGRRLSDNEEIDDAPESAHVKRTAMEDFSPEAHVIRRSMPFIDGDEEGLVFLSFADSLTPFEVQLKRMIGMDDNIVDGLFRFSRPTTGGHYWCPPTQDDKLDLSTLL